MLNLLRLNLLGNKLKWFLGKKNKLKWDNKVYEFILKLCIFKFFFCLINKLIKSFFFRIEEFINLFLSLYFLYENRDIFLK